ncbi:MAG: hypothetical protein OES84_01165 [Kiritimatiellaceae bacterium]|nr:hypothetical protein [Kiritimatiellaceae bacterium]
MTKYDPSNAPSPSEWNDLSENQKLDMIKAYHEMIGLPVPNINFHAGLHLIVESQIAMGDAIPVNKEFTRLLSEGADRHAAIHAVATAFKHLKEKAELHPSIRPSVVSYYREIEALNGAKLK